MLECPMMTDLKALMRTLKSFFILTFFLFYSTAFSAETILHSVDGDEIKLSSLKGKWVFINYWASWCQPCLDEISELNHFYEDNKARNVAVFAINYDGMPLKKQQQLIKKFDIRYPSLKQNVAKTLHLGSINAVPMTFVLNPQGELSTTLYGGQTMASLNEAMVSLPAHQKKPTPYEMEPQ